MHERADRTAGHEPTTAERNHAEALVRRAAKTAEDAREVVERIGLRNAATEVGMAIDCLMDAAADIAGRH